MRARRREVQSMMGTPEMQLPFSYGTLKVNVSRRRNLLINRLASVLQSTDTLQMMFLSCRDEILFSPGRECATSPLPLGRMSCAVDIFSIFVS